MEQYLVVVLVASVIAGGFGILTDLYQPCCHEGVLWSASSGRCNNFPGAIPNVSDADYPSCMSIIEVCCIKEVHQRQCAAGKDTAIAGSICAARDADPGAEQYMECCHCCRLGLEARNSRLECARPGFGDPCDMRFMECCTGLSAAQLLNSTGSSSSSSGSSSSSSSSTAGGSHRGGTINGNSTGQRDSATSSRNGGWRPPAVTLAPGDDMDECVLFPGQLCSQICVNTVGSFRCECEDGFRLDRDGRTCTKLPGTDAQERAVSCSSANPCEQLCFDTADGVECGCYPGYKLDSNGALCNDIDECTGDNPVCSAFQTCVNSPGSYTCSSRSCPSGLVLNPSTGLCELTQQCPPGFGYNSISASCEDLNECGLGLDDCGVGMRCENTEGSFTCRRETHCGTGYTLDDQTQQCIDNNECQLGTHNCGRGYECQNTEGSFRCRPRECPPGYRFSLTRGECERIVCTRGLKPDAAGNCIDINECTEYGNVCASYQTCVNTVGSYQCRSNVNCPNGFRPNAQGRCNDIDECAEGIHMCTGDQQCINRQGSYYCQCPPGHTSDGAGRCIDNDECAYGATICPANSRCENTVGSYKCACNEGLVEDANGLCQDINECERENICHHSCVNVIGTYFCSCNRGFQLSNDRRTCEDIDECQHFGGRGSVCGGTCVNTMGSYTCGCPEGWRLKRDGRSCEDIDECTEGTGYCPGRDSICYNVRGTYKCPVVRCPEGFVKVPSGSGRNSIRCKRVTNDCPDCMRGLLSLSYNFLTFPSNVIVPAPLFSMSGTPDSTKIFTWDLTVESARPGRVGVTQADSSFFSLEESLNMAVVSLTQRIDAPQDIAVKLSMNITNLYTGFEGTAESRILIYVTENTNR